MTEKNFNGFSSEEQYLQAFETIKEIVEDNDTYDRDTFMVYKEDEYIAVFIDDYEIDIWDGDILDGNIEIQTQEDIVDRGIIKIVVALANAQFDKYFSI